MVASNLDVPEFLEFPEDQVTSKGDERWQNLFSCPPEAHSALGALDGGEGDGILGIGRGSWDSGFESEGMRESESQKIGIGAI